MTQPAVIRPGFVVCICPDAGLIRAQVETQLMAHLPVSTGENGHPEQSQWERHTFWGDGELPQHFWEHLTLQGLTGVSRALVLRQAHLMPAAVWKRLSAALAVPNDKAWLFICLEVQWEKGQPKTPAHINKLRCLAFATQKNWVWRSAGLDERGFKKYATERAKALGLCFAAGALDAFATAVAPVSVAVEGELAKLALSATDNVIRPEMCSAGAYVPEHNIFAFIRHIQTGNFVAAWQEIQRDQKDDMLFPLLGLLMRDARILWQVQAGEDVRLHPQEAQSRRDMAARLGYSGISRLIEHIVRTEWHIKSGQRSSEQALEALTADLARLFASVLSY